MTKIDALITLGKLKTTQIFIIENNTDFLFVSTKQNIDRYIFNIKYRNKTNNKLKELLNTTYTYNLIETFEFDTQNELNHRINYLTFETEKKKRKKEDLIYGKNEEYAVLEKIKKYFYNDIIVMCNYTYSSFDFMGLKSEYLYELKSNNDKFEDFPNAIIGVEKVLDYDKQIFLFQFKNELGQNDLYYFIKPPQFKEQFIKRQIYLKYRDKHNWIYDIPRTNLIKINKGDIYDLPIATTNTEIFKHLKALDQMKSE